MNARAPRCALCVQYRIAAVGVSGKEMSDVDRWSGSNSCRAYLTQPNARDLRAALVVRNDRSIFKGQSVDNVSRLSVVLVYRQAPRRGDGESFSGERHRAHGRAGEGQPFVPGRAQLAAA